MSVCLLGQFFNPALMALHTTVTSDVLGAFLSTDEATCERNRCALMRNT